MFPNVFAQELLLLTIARALALAVLASEAMLLWFRRNEPEHTSRPLSRLVWAATPAAVLVGMSLWCASHLVETRASPLPGAVAAADDRAR